MKRLILLQLRRRKMKKLLLLLAVLFCASSVYGGEVNVLGVVAGQMTATGSYYAVGGGNPYFENRYKSDYWSVGTSGFGMNGNFSGDITTQERLTVQDGFGTFITKAGKDSLVNTTDEGTGLVYGVYTQGAIGFGGRMTQGVATMGLDTAGGLKGLAESEGFGSFRVGAIQQTTTGTSEGIDPSVAERMEFHWVFGPGQYQVQIGVTFPE